jgi:ATP-dependent DNA helicase DinG
VVRSTGTVAQVSGSAPHHGATEDLARLLERVAEALPGGGEHRPGQLEMAERVERALHLGRNLVAQAGTGTGKSLAYLLPAATSGLKVVVTTATKALQDQLAEKDLPFLASQLEESCERDGRRAISFAVLKGRSNYLCRQRAAEVSGASSTEGPQQFYLEADGEAGGAVADDAGKGGERDEPAGNDRVDRGSFADQLRRILAWAETSETGDRAQLDFEPSPRAWAALSVGPRECPGAFRCPSGGACFAERARALAAASDIVVVNTHLYATHLASDGVVLPEHDVLVVDEVHAFEDVVTEGLGVELSPGRIRAVGGLSRPIVDRDELSVADAVIEAADLLERAARPLSGRRLVDVDHRELDEAVALATSRVEALSATLRRGEQEDPDARRTRALLSAGHLLDDLHEIRDPQKEDVVWVDAEGPAARAVSIRLAPIEVGPILASRLWPDVTAVLTSATVPPLLEQRLGLPPSDTDRVDVGSPFPYETCALLYCPTDLPDRRDPGAEDALHGELHAIIDAAGGRTLALFTSWRAMRAAVEALRPRLELPVLAQNDLPKRMLIEAFEKDQSSCLFATMSFWQGVDVPGATLSVVAIDRLPFPRPDDPLLISRRERAGDNAFRLVDLPKAATLLAQGAGRLIRSSRDSGMVAVLDRRLATAGYSRVLRQALPPMRFTTRRPEAMSFLASLRDKADEAASAGQAFSG